MAIFVFGNRTKSNLPGPCLIAAADYLHDCLRDPGLHCGFEATDPPVPIAARFVSRWLSHIVEFLADAWADPEFTEAQATALSRWVGEELMPSCPRGLWFQPAGAHTADSIPRLGLMMAMGMFVRVRDVRRANVGLRTLASALGMNDDEFLSITVEALHAID